MRTQAKLRLTITALVLFVTTFASTDAVKAQTCCHLSDDGTRNWVTTASFNQLKTPIVDWEVSLPADSLQACFPIHIRQSDNREALAIVTSLNHNNRLFLLDASTGRERWRVNVPSIDSVYSLRDSYEQDDRIIFSGFVLNDRIFVVAGYHCNLEVDRQTGDERGFSYSLDASHSAKPGPRLRTDGKYYVAGNAAKATRVSTLVETGQVEHSSNIGFNGFRDAWPSSISALNDGSLLVTGSGYGADLDLAPWLLKTTAAGDSLWSYYGSEEAGDNIMLIPSHSLELSDGSIITLASARTRKNGTPGFLHLMKFSADGQFQWARPYPSSSSTMGNGFVSLKNGMFAIAGLTGFTPGDEMSGAEDFYLLVLDNQFNVVQEYRWGLLGKVDQLTTISVASNGDLLVGGVTDGAENQQGAKNYFARIPLASLSVPTTQVASKKLGIRPNPATNSARVSFDAPPGVIQVELVDVKGDVVRRLYSGQHAFGILELNIDLTDVIPGYYFVRLTSSAGVTASPLLKY